LERIFSAHATFATSDNMFVCKYIVPCRARVSTKVEGGIGIEIGYFFKAHQPFKGGITQVELL